jgi:hypothetical protein
LEGARVPPIVGELVATGMAQHVWMHWELKLGPPYAVAEIVFDEDETVTATEATELAAIFAESGELPAQKLN